MAPMRCKPRACSLSCARAQSGRYRLAPHRSALRPAPSSDALAGGRSQSSGRPQHGPRARSGPAADRRTMLNEFHRIAFCERLHASIADLRAELPADLDEWIRGHDDARPHQGRCCFGKTPTRTFLDAIPNANEKTRRLSDRGQTKPTSEGVARASRAQSTPLCRHRRCR